MNRRFFGLLAGAPQVSPTCGNNRINFLIIANLPVLLILLLSSCISPAEPDEEFWLENPFMADPGQIYEINFVTAIDTLQSGTLYTGRTELLKTPLAEMAHKAIIIKADDLKGQISDKWQRYFGIVESHDIYHSAGIICNSIASITNQNRNDLIAHLERRCEFWLHGWNHNLSDTLTEFQGSSYQDQFDNLRRSVDTVTNQLGYTMHTFGAPGNRYDDNTIAALNAVPELHVWLGGTDSVGLLNIPIAWVAENPSGTLRDPESFLERIKIYGQRDAIMMQVHPNAWDEEEMNNFDIILGSLTQSDSTIFMTPYQYFKRVADRDSVSVFKVDSTTYRFDFTRAQYDHLFEFDQPFTFSIFDP